MQILSLCYHVFQAEEAPKAAEPAAEEEEEEEEAAAEETPKQEETAKPAAPAAPTGPATWLVSHSEDGKHAHAFGGFEDNVGKYVKEAATKAKAAPAPEAQQEAPKPAAPPPTQQRRAPAPKQPAAPRQPPNPFPPFRQ